MKDPRTAYHECEIPMLLQARIVAPIKQANFKITLAGSQEIPPMNEVFDDFIQNDPDSEQHLANPNVASFQLANGVDCTLLIAKTGSKIFENIFSYVKINLESRVQSLKDCSM